ncbi:response regulator [Azospirillum halopraeferens]|uniref:response regulator n=1 Tax=Azospirillum halopraeferens TaxID=34010 RepID=UPI0003F94C1E|nr:response regulator [Azospirillum halopraeferens]
MTGYPAPAPFLLLAPEGRDAEVIGFVLGEIGIVTRVCADLPAVCDALDADASGLIVSEIALSADVAPLLACLDAQPPWSDLPVLVLTSRGDQPGGRDRRALFGRLGNVTLLERPMHAEALQSAARAALRARERQYRTRSHLREIELSAERLERRVEERTRELSAEIAERRRAEEALLHARKLEIMGRLTGGVAHDVNNVLQAIGSGLFMLDRHVPDGRARTLFDAARQSVDRGAALTQSLLAFARRQALMPRPTGLRELLKGMEPLLERSLGGMIRITVEVAPDTADAMVDRGQLESAILNLAINARDAMPSGGHLRLCAGNTVVDHRGEPGRPPDIAPGHYVVLSVADDGAGMDGATLERAFEPFFTTKAIGKGSGLGLSMVHGMAAQSGGGVWIASTPGRGTTVTLYLPGVPREERDAGEEENPAPPEPARRAGGETILLVDDDAVVRMGTAALLESLGYRVVEADGGDTALAILRDGTAVDALVTDFAMPGMNGATLVREARRVAPHVPVLLVTGYADAPDFDAPVTILHKPFSAGALERSMATILDPGR